MVRVLAYVITVLALGLGATGCGKPPDREPSSEPAESPSVANDVAAGAQAKAGTLTSPPVPVQPPIVRVPLRISRSGEALTPTGRALLPALAFEADGNFVQALVECRRLAQVVTNESAVAELAALTERVTNEKYHAVGLQFAVADLGSADPQVVERARRRLLLAEGAGTVYLRKALRESPDAVAIQAVRILQATKDPQWIPTLVRRVHLNPASPNLREFLVAINKVVGQVAPVDLALLSGHLAADPAFEHWPSADILCAAYRTGGKVHAERFNKLIGDDTAAERLKAYVEGALASSKGRAFAWARGQIASFDITQPPFVKRDMATKGDWEGIYGTKGWQMPRRAPKVPPFVTMQVSQCGARLWEGALEDLRVLQEGRKRPAAHWHHPKQVTVSLAFKDKSFHWVSVYLLDLDDRGRGVTVVLQDAANKAVNTQKVDSYEDGVWLVYLVQERATLQFTNTGKDEIALCGIFFD